MKVFYRAVLCGLLFYMPAYAVAVELSETDKELIRHGIIDNTLRYTDLALAADYFGSVTRAVAASLPMPVNNQLQVERVFMSPYFSEFTYRYTIAFTALEKRMLKEEFLSERSIKDFCNDDYLSENFMPANGHILVFKYVDESFDPIVDIKMSPKTCQ
ncbi:hypothetical protein [Psychrobacter sp. H8-1]|uniref:hypothetical protein n=1 Tax=Psychrobacter sp. H8-1 TaxID=2774129 RepID=UPI001917FAFB|nr:hypothetical protein [Psychrobacter sp. H8-1]